MALLLLSLLCLVQSDVTASASAVSGVANVSATRQGDAVALLRVTGKTKALELRAARPVTAKYAGGNAGAMVPAAAFLWLDRAPAAQAAVISAPKPAPRTHTNQPRAPPSA